MPWAKVQRRTRYRKANAERTDSLNGSRSCGFVNRSHDRTDDYHLDESVDASVNDQLSWKRLDCINSHAHADRRDLQQNPQSDSRHYAATGEAARINHHERENQKRLADNDPVEQAHHFTLRAPEIRRFGVNVLEQNTVQKPTPSEHEYVRCDERNDESFHESESTLRPVSWTCRSRQCLRRHRR